MFTAANIIAISPNKFEISIFDVLLAANAAIIAPTIITDDMALEQTLKVYVMTELHSRQHNSQ